MNSSVASPPARARPDKCFIVAIDSAPSSIEHGHSNRLTTRATSYLGTANRTELWLAISFFVFSLAVRGWSIFHYRFDSDESQHLHVVWAWTQGLVQYRDTFDNHMPLFQLLCAPILAAMGDHANDLYWMRLLMLPLYLTSLWCVYRIGATIFSRRTGVWAVILVSCYSEYQFCSTEFRTDNLWALLWLLCLLLLVSGPFSFRRALVSGLLLGLCFGVSMKSLLMLLSLTVGAIMTLLVVGWPRSEMSARKSMTLVAVFLLGVATVPAVIFGYFAANGLWPELRYCVFEHNLLSRPATGKTYFHTLIPLVVLPLLVYFARRIFRRRAYSEPMRRGLFLALVGCSYFLLLLGIWGHATKQDYLPYFPLVAIFGAAILDWIPMPQTKNLALTAPSLVTLLLIVFSLGPAIPRANETAHEVKLVRDVISLTQPSDYVFDRKGETIFRRRPFYYVLEGMTRERLRRGLITDDSEQRCVETQTCVAVIGDSVPLDDRKFILANYLPVTSQLRVAGYRLAANASPRAAIEFNVLIPASYEVVAADATVAGLLDGKPYQGARFLEPGKHEFKPEKPEPALAVIWAQAAERHFTPFPKGPHSQE